MTLDQITPLVLTFNEAPNIGRTMAGLSWASRVVVMDSGSTDGTVEALAAHRNVDVIDRPFDTHRDQWNAGLDAVETPWVLCLDADYVLTRAFVDEIAALGETGSVVGYEAPFVYLVQGTPLRGSLYPPRVVLFRRDSGRYVQDGHTQALDLRGPIQTLRSPIGHDDRKPRARWLSNQAGYAVQEVEKLLAADPATLSRADRARRLGLGPVLAPLYCLFWKRLALDGKAGLTYTYERTYGETLIALGLLDRRLRSGNRPASDHA